MDARFDDVIADFAKDPAKENEGVWMNYGRHQFLISRAHRNNARFLKLLEQEMRPYQWALDRGNLSAIKDAFADVLQTVYSKTVLLGIRKLDGTVLDYSPEDGVALFKKVPDLWDKIFAFSNNESNYSPDKIEADSKN